MIDDILVNEAVKTWELFLSAPYLKLDNIKNDIINLINGFGYYDTNKYQEFQLFEKDPREYLKNLREQSFDIFFHGLQKIKYKYFKNEEDQEDIESYIKKFPKFLQTLTERNDNYIKYIFIKYKDIDLRPILRVAEDMPKYFQISIIDALLYNFNKAYVLIHFALEFPILRNQFCDYLVDLKSTPSKIKNDIHLAELIIKDFGQNKNFIERYSYAFSGISYDKINTENYKEFFNKLLNDSYSPSSVTISYQRNNNINFLDPHQLSFPNAGKFCKLFNSSFKIHPQSDSIDIHKLIDFLVIHWNKDHNFAPKLADFFSFNKHFNVMSILEFKVISKLITSSQIPCSNLDQLSNLFKGFNLIYRKLHNLYGNPFSVKLELKNLIDNIIITFLINKYDSSSDLLSKAMDLVLNDSLVTEANFKTKCLELGINSDDLRHRLESLKQQFFFHRLQLNKAEIYDFDNKINLIESYSGILEYKQYKKDKIPELYNLNYIISDHLKFEVLSNNSFEYFTVGAETGCCQRLKREGVAACVDSYINPMAGVLVLRGNNKIVIAQSYFHYVPEENGYILDNIETNDWAVKHFKVDLESVYASLGAKLKESGVSYFHCGKQYNKLNSSFFKNKKIINDQRHFEIQALDLELDNGYDTTTEIYTDYSEEYLDLYQPSNNVTLIDLHKLEKTSALSLQFYLMTLKLGL